MPQGNYDAAMTALREANLDFDAVMRPVSFLGEDGEYHKTKMMTPVRSDNGTIISEHTFTKAYHPIQNRDAFKIISDISQVSDVQFKNVGSWGNGAGVYAQISIGDDLTVGGNDDRVGRYLSIVNSHDGSRGCSILITPLRFFCMNQISPAIKSAEENNIFSVRHNSLAVSRLKIAAETVRVVNGVFQHTQEVYSRMADFKVNMDHVREVMARCLPFKENEADGGEPNAHWEDMLTGMVNRFHSSDNGHVETFTAWNLYNAIQGTFQHDTRNSANKAQSILLGGIAQHSRKALNEVVDIIAHPNVRTVHPEFDREFNRIAA